MCWKDGEDGVILDITGCAHLFGGEDKLIADLLNRLAARGISARAAAADTPAAAWAWARFGDSVALTDPKHLLKLPIQALRLESQKIGDLKRLGLSVIRQLSEMPRAPLTTRFGPEVLKRLDRLFGADAEPISPQRPPARWRARISFPDGIGRREDIDLAVRALLDELCAALAIDGYGARRLELDLFRLDGDVQTLAIGTHRPSREPLRLMRLFAERLDRVEPGFGIETMILSAAIADAITPQQTDLEAARNDNEGLPALIDRLENRLGRGAVSRLSAVDSHWPERAAAATPALEPQRGDWPQGQRRPLRLLDPPEEIDAIGPPGQAPRRFIWRRAPHDVTLATGPERIGAEWWRTMKATPGRDYFWVQDSAGARFWIYREGAAQASRWRLHGLFA